ncbi:MAG: DUF2905 domain-containing protein [Dehalococcoidia bacterium]|nr:DUF2905 domain-containing protein [Dehalococcoidia bacterium]
MLPRHTGTAIILVGMALVVLGGLVAAGALGWFGRLPGDVRIETERVRVYAPLASMLVVSILISVVVAVFRRLL